MNNNNLNDAIERIKRLECPTDQVEERVIGILKSYGIENGQIKVKKDEIADKYGNRRYHVKLPQKDIKIIAKAGYDDYVAGIVNVKLQ